MKKNILWMLAAILSYSFAMPYSPQPDRRVYSLFAPRLIPRIYVSDAQGIIRHMYVDIGMPTAETIVENIKTINKK